MTLPELLLVLALVAILMVTAVPNLTGLLKGSEVDREQSALAATLALARSEAIKRAGTVRVCGTVSGTCGSSDTGATSWAAGWRIRVQADGTILQQHEGIAATTQISYACGDYIDFDSTGRRASSGTAVCGFSISDSGGSSAYDRSLVLSPTGRLRMQ